MAESTPINEEKPLSVFLADDHGGLREGLKKILRSRGIQIAGEAHSLETLLEQVDDYPDAIFVVDLNMSDTKGTTVIQQLTRKKPDVPIVVYSQNDSISVINEAYNQGALAYIPKAYTHIELINAIRGVAEGKKYIPEDVKTQLAEAITSGEIKPDPRRVLDEEHLLILTRKCLGYSYEDMAKTIGSTTRTVKYRLTKIKEILNVEENADLVRICQDFDLI